jgi:exopolysaccharide biosynthesis polyprenyl glycosylphosphotransferase
VPGKTSAKTEAVEAATGGQPRGNGDLRPGASGLPGSGSLSEPGAAVPWPHEAAVALERGSDQPIPEAGTSRVVRRRDALYRRLLALGDVVAAASALALGVLVLSQDDKLSPLLFAGIPLVVLVSKVIGLYDRDEHLLSKSTLDEAPALFQVATLYTLLIWLGEPVFMEGHLGRDQIVGIWGLLFLLMLVSRQLARQVALARALPERCLVLGDPRAADRVRKKLDSSNTINATVVGRMPLVGGMPTTKDDLVLGDIERLGVVLADHDIHRVIIAPRTADSEHLLDTIRLAKAMGVKVSVLPRMFEVVGSSVRFDDVQGLTLLGVPHFGLTNSSQLLKRGMDVAGSAAALLLLAPLMVAIALAVKLTSSGPAFFRQTRIGRGGRAFEMLKFRTMIERADEQKGELYYMNEADGLFKIADDPRLTRVGRFLRRLSLDELPQLINVLRGNMSLVGPRPLVADDDRLVEGWHRRRLDVPPGITGVWQVLGSSRVPLDEMVTIDYLYAANWSLWLDLKIMMRTVPYMLARRGM